MLKILEFMSHFPFRCGHQEPEPWLYLADTARSADAHLQPYGHRLHPSVAVAAYLHEGQHLVGKYNTKIGHDGVGLSQGQRQRILIARAVYKNPDYIFLDEATNSLDANNERAIVENLDTFYRGKTVVIVAHRA